MSAAPGPMLTLARHRAHGPGDVLRRYPLAVLVLLTFGLSWLLEVPWVLDTRGALPFTFPVWAVLLMGWMPGVAALGVAAATGGRAAVIALLNQFRVWRVGPVWYLLVVDGSAALWLAAVGLNPLFGGLGLQLPALSPGLLVGALVGFVLLFVVNSEELVWRGSLLPRLQARWGLLTASVVIGIVEGLFHLPLFFRPDSDQAATGLPVFLLGSIAGAVLFSWIYTRTRGSLLLVQLFHVSANTWISLFPAAPPDNVVTQWLFNGLLVAAALCVVAAGGLHPLAATAAPSRTPAVT